MGRRVLLVALVIALMFPAAAAATPVFNCEDVAVRRAHPAQCPQVGVPGILGGDPTPGASGGGGAHCSGLCGIVKGVLGSVGLGGLL